MDLLEFDGQLKQEQAKTPLPDECKDLAGPGYLGSQNQLQWTFVWAIHFTSDNKYLRIWEMYDRVARLVESRRIQFVFHYGPLVLFDAKGAPMVDALGPLYSSKDPVDIRIDTIHRKAHLHYGAPNPHYGQDRVDGLDLGSIDKFTFVRAVLKHRDRKEPLDRILKFRTI